MYYQQLILGSCTTQGFTDGCCVSDNPNHDCAGSTGICYCDVDCYELGDCCADIAEAGCFEGNYIEL